MVVAYVGSTERTAGSRRPHVCECTGCHCCLRRNRGPTHPSLFYSCYILHFTFLRRRCTCGTAAYSRVKTSLNLATTVAFSSAVPMVMRKQPAQPGSLPRYRTTTPSSSANVLYTFCARTLSGLPLPVFSKTGITTKLASFPPMAAPRSFSVDSVSSSLLLSATSDETFFCIDDTASGESADNANAAVGVEMLYGVLVFIRI